MVDPKTDLLPGEVPHEVEEDFDELFLEFFELKGRKDESLSES